MRKVENDRRAEEQVSSQLFAAVPHSHGPHKNLSFSPKYVFNNLCAHRLVFFDGFSANFTMLVLRNNNGVRALRFYVYILRMEIVPIMFLS